MGAQIWGGGGRGGGGGGGGHRFVYVMSPDLLIGLSAH